MRAGSVGVLGATLLLVVGFLPSAPAQGGATTLTLHCDDPAADARAMETGYIEQGCWGHVGHHTYLVGRDRSWHLYGGSGRAFVTEQQLSPPVEGYGASADGPSVVTPVVPGPGHQTIP